MYKYVHKFYPYLRKYKVHAYMYVYRYKCLWINACIYIHRNIRIYTYLYSYIKGFMFEVRWFRKASELNHKQKLILDVIISRAELQSNEIIESELLDDVACGAIIEKVSVSGYYQEESKEELDKISANNVGLPVYVCRFMEMRGSQTIQKIRNSSIFARGMPYSSYAPIYAKYVKEYMEKGDLYPTDIYSTAIRRLHMSVLPDNLPCRSDERVKVQDAIREVIVDSSKTKSLYISGLPGTGKTATVLASISFLIKEASKKTIPSFEFVEINCLHITSPSEVYVLLWRFLTGIYV
jgi:hypothetical protein